MHLLRPALLLTVFMLAGANGKADELLPDQAQPSTSLASASVLQAQQAQVQAQAQVQQEPSGWNYPPDITKIDPNCALGRDQIFSLTVDSLLWRLEQGGRHEYCMGVANPSAHQRYTDDLDMGFQVGPRIMMTYYTEEGSAIEVGYSGIYDWGASDLVSDPTNKLRLPDTLGTPNFGPVDFSNADAIGITYQANFNSVEANLLYGKPAEGITGLIGARFLRYDENLDLRGFVNSYPASAYMPAGGYSDYTVGTKNEMFGVQGGAKYHFALTPCLDLDGFMKMGVYNNNAQQSTYQDAINRAVIERNFNPHQSLTAFAGDFNVSLQYHLNCTWSLRFGYNAMIMSGIARATDQLDYTSSNEAGSRLFFNERVFMHGFNIGLDGKW